VIEFQVPAHTAPLLATVAMAGLLDWKLNVSVICWFRTFLALGVSPRVWPTSSDWLRPLAHEVEGDGHKLTLAGIWLGITLVGLLLPQPANAKKLARI
jgi:hypothetical protein